MKVLVCGGRDFSNQKYLFDSLDAIHYHEGERERIKVIIHGDYRGADKLADAWALYRGVQPARCPANWPFFGREAGPLRNAAMLLLVPDLVVAFEGGHGTAKMVALAEAAGVKVKDLRISLGVSAS